jgi:hypothetical protein
MEDLDVVFQMIKIINCASVALLITIKMKDIAKNVPPAV